VADSGKNETGDATLEGLKESQSSLLKGKNEVTLAKFNAVRSGNSVDELGIKAQGVESHEEIARRGISGGRSRPEGQENDKECKADAHTSSVVIFGMDGQGGPRGAS